MNMNWLAFWCILFAFILGIKSVDLWWVLLIPAVIFGVFGYLYEDDFDGI